MMLKVVSLKEEHLEDAAVLVSNRYQRLYEQEPHLSNRYSEVTNLLPLLRNILSASEFGVSAFHGDRLVGFLTGWQMPSFRGKRSVYSPEWANAVESGNSSYIYEELYRHIAENWVAEKYVAHYISIFSSDLEAIRAWHWLGFGMTAVDAVRGLQPIKGANPQIDIRLASVQDVEKVMELHDGLVQHSKGSPSFFIADKYNKEYFVEWLNDPERLIWLAYVNEEPVSYIRIGPANDDVSTIIYDEKTTSIYGAYTQETLRGKDIATSILACAIESARSAGYERCAVDFEPMNLLGTRFWLRHDFKPVCFSLLRYVDDRVV